MFKLADLLPGEFKKSTGGQKMKKQKRSKSKGSLVQLIEIPEHRLKRIRSKSINLSRNIMLGIHMIRSPKHFDIFPVLGDMSEELFKRRALLELVHPHPSGEEIRLLIGWDFIMVPTESGAVIYKVVETAPGRYGYLKHKNVDKQEVDATNVPSIKIDPSFRYVGPINNRSDMMVQDLADQGKVSFRPRK